VVTAEVVVFNEVGDGPLKLAGEFIRDLVHFPLDALVVALQLPVSLGMKWRCQDMPDTNEVQIVPEGPADIIRSVVREQSGAVLDRHLGHPGDVDNYDKKDGTNYYERLVNFIKHLQKNDFVVFSGVNDVKGDRSLRSSQQKDPDQLCSGAEAA